jgi:hypothetical protein
MRLKVDLTQHHSTTMTAAPITSAERFSPRGPLGRLGDRAGITSHNAIAAKLNERNVRTARGGKWTHVQVGTVLRPFEQSEAGAVV